MKKYGLLGSNKSTEDTIKLFPRDCMDLVNDIQKKVLDRTGKHVEVMVYGDGAFKDPVGKSGSWLTRLYLLPIQKDWKHAKRSKIKISG